MIVIVIVPYRKLFIPTRLHMQDPFVVHLIHKCSEV